MHTMRLKLSCIWMAILLTWAGAQPPENPTHTPPAVKETPTATSWTVEFSREGNYERWFEDAKGKPLGAPQRMRDQKATFDAPADAAVLWIQDPERGNMAKVDLKSAKNPLTINSESWTHIRRLRVDARSEGKPVASAVLTLSGAKGYSTSETLESTSGGTTTFERVPMGTVTLKAEYGDGKTATQEADIKLDRENPEPRLEIALAGAPVLDSPIAKSKEGQSGGTEGAPPRSALNQFGVVVMFILAIGLAAATILFLIKLATKNEDKLSDAMQKMGVQLPSVQDPDATASVSSAMTSAPAQAPLVPEGFCPFCGQKLDASGQCSCQQLGSTAPAVSASVITRTGVLRLVGMNGVYAGREFPIQDDLVTVGRDMNNPIALPDDSTISRRHAQLMRESGNLTVQDLGSSNGTYVNGSPIQAETLLQTGDTVQFGSSLFRVED